MKTLRRLPVPLRLGFVTAATAIAESFPGLGTVPRIGGFQMDGYWVWCGSVIKGDDGRYHIFASRWPKDITFHPGWMCYSEIVRAVADKPEGPYQFQQVVLPSRGRWHDANDGATGAPVPVDRKWQANASLRSQRRWPRRIREHDQIAQRVCPVGFPMTSDWKGALL